MTESKQPDSERLDILAAWHSEQGNEARRLEHKGRSPWMIDQHGMRAAHHEGAAIFLSRLASDLKIRERGAT